MLTIKISAMSIRSLEAGALYHYKIEVTGVPFVSVVKTTLGVSYYVSYTFTFDL